MASVIAMARNSLIEQNAVIARVVMHTFVRRVQLDTGKSFDEYLNDLFICLETPYRGQGESREAQEVMEVMRRLRQVLS